jgi:hypothetical protein
MAKKPSGFLPKLLRDNVLRLTGRERGVEVRLRKATGLGAASAHRLTVGQNVKLDTLQIVAESYDLEAWELLTPDFDAERPPRKRLAGLEEEVQILRQQLHDVRLALEVESADDVASRNGAPGRRGNDDSGPVRSDPAAGKAKGHKPKAT